MSGNERNNLLQDNTQNESVLSVLDDEAIVLGDVTNTNNVVVMSDDDTSHLQQKKCDHCGEVHDSKDIHHHQTSKSADITTNVTSCDDANVGEPEKSEYKGYIMTGLTAVGLTIGCLVCHHVACPVVALKAGVVAGSKLAAAKATIHHFIAKTVGAQCCCCSCTGCNGCCGCGSACCGCIC